ncbi:hypothetical protein [Elizabethkingia sp. JS20170427COW]|uniref:hypothetical protein n=1 Tax=Elizabethkingia sp. JS20170427COW TaxID=2583851 RepID=UPI0011103B7F|nr:hypothetical protein [Elizabethkingia sp. JS20170427COW]QCX52853.1 hypothetical protein FGE20_03435 [Elizabethkingia sp. JS20170427COW]
MKKILFSIFVAALAFNSCQDDNYYTQNTYPTLDEATQKAYDEEAIKNYLENTYITSRGKITSSETDANNSEIKNKKLADLNPQTLPSGVIYIEIPNAQPNPGVEIKDKDYLKFQQVGYALRAIESDGKVQFTSPITFYNTIDGGGVPLDDPQFYYVKQKVLDAAQKLVDEKAATAVKAATQRSYYEIEGFQEGIKKFKSFDIADDVDYNMQGIIIVPSRLAFGKDSHYNYIGISLNDYSFVFNIQVYKSRARDMNNSDEK